MIDALFKRKVCRDFLKAYSEDLYKEVIPDVFEIGVLSLEKSFKKILFSNEELREIIDELRGDDYFKDKETKKIEKLGKNQNKIIPQSLKVQDNKDIYPSWWGKDTDEECKEEIEKQIKSEQNKKKKGLKRHHKKRHHNYSSESSSTSDSYYDHHPMIMNQLRKPPPQKYEIKNKTNYKISYDKDLKPESIEKKNKEPKYSYSTGREGLKRQPSVERLQQPIKVSNKELRNNATSFDKENEEQYNQSQEYPLDEVVENAGEYHEDLGPQENQSHHSHQSQHSQIPKNQLNPPQNCQQSIDVPQNYQPKVPVYRQHQQINEKKAQYQPLYPSNPTTMKSSNENNNNDINNKNIPKTIENNNIDVYPSDTHIENYRDDKNIYSKQYDFRVNNEIHEKQQNDLPPSYLQNSNLSNYHNEQLSMIEVNDEMKHLFRNKFVYQYDNKNNDYCDNLCSDYSSSNYNRSTGYGNTKTYEIGK